jgi:hypothetical protein
MMDNEVFLRQQWVQMGMVWLMAMMGSLRVTDRKTMASRGMIILFVFQ